jgi:internalin A
MLRPLDPRCQVVQFHSRLSDDDFRRLADFMTPHPDVCLRAYGSYDRSISDLDFLRHFPSHRSFQVDVSDLRSIDGLGYLPTTVRDLGLGRTAARLSLAPLARFTELRRLYLEGHTKDIDVLGHLGTVTSLTLRSITLPDLTPLRPLTRLRAFELKLGGTRNLAALPDIGRLEYLEIWQVRGLNDLSPISGVVSLEWLALQSLKQVTALPDMTRLATLGKVYLTTMKGLRDLTPLAAAPALERVGLFDMGHLVVEDLDPLKNHPTLREVRLGLNSNRKNAAGQELLGLPTFEDWTPHPAIKG